jgi:hypothetical protein
MSKEFLGVRTDYKKLLKAAADELGMTISAVHEAALRRVCYPHLTQNQTILDTLVRIGRELTSGEVLAAEKGKAEQLVKCIDTCCFDCSRILCNQGFSPTECALGYSSKDEGGRHKSCSCEEDCLRWQPKGTDQK